MPDPQNFLDNLENLRLVMSVAVEHFQRNRQAFAQVAKPAERHDAETLMAKVRTLAEQLQEEFGALQALLAKAASS